MQQTVQKTSFNSFCFPYKSCEKIFQSCRRKRMISTVELKFGFIVNLDGRNRVISDLYTYLPTQAD